MGGSESHQSVRPGEANRLVEHFFRHESANLISVLTRAFGFNNIDLVEDAVQSAMITAMNSWKQSGPPDRPAAWIHRVARNKLLDVLRRQKTHQKALAFAGYTDENTNNLLDQWLDEKEIPDSLLRMMFVCCHPSLDQQTQIAMTLKILCGFSVGEIARGLLMKSETIKKRIQRAKSSLAEQTVTIDFPQHSELQERLTVVHHVLYLIFNEGYSSSSGVKPIRDDVCEEATRLCHLLCEHSELESPDTKALLALMLFHASRLDARTDSSGTIVLLGDQDRSKWDLKLIQVAHRWLQRSATPRPSRFHFEAFIAQEHCLAKSVEETDWNAIIQLYDQLLLLNDSPVYRLNRAIAIGQAGDVKLALEEVELIRSSGKMKQYFLLDCAAAQLYEQGNELKKAKAAYHQALSYELADHEKRLISKKLDRLG